MPEQQIPPPGAKPEASRQGFLRGMKKGIKEKGIDWFKPALMQDEKMISEFTMGYFISLYKVFATNKRVMVIKRFPKNLVEMLYDDIEFVEYYTNVEWAKALYSAGLFILAFAFLFGRETMMSELVRIIPPLSFLVSGEILGLTYGAFLIFAALLCGAIYSAGLFFVSMLGCLRILLKEQAPFDISTPFTQDIQNLIKIVETRRVR